MLTNPLIHQPSAMGVPRCSTTTGFDRALARASLATSDPLSKDMMSMTMPNTMPIPNTPKPTSNPNSHFQFLSNQLLG